MSKTLKFNRSLVLGAGDFAQDGEVRKLDDHKADYVLRNGWATVAQPVKAPPAKPANDPKPESAPSKKSKAKAKAKPQPQTT